jgi:malonate-semialdehyde dehydrogenase (acetylating)/methylmalonate-semialdehyde dehydrogenase
MKLIQHFVNGKISSGKSERTGKIFNPATGEQESEVKLGSK